MHHQNENRLKQKFGVEDLKLLLCFYIKSRPASYYLLLKP